MTTEQYRYDLAHSVPTLPKTAFTGWTVGTEPKSCTVAYFDEYYRDHEEGLPISGDDTARTRAWLAATGNQPRHQLGVDVNTGAIAINDNKGENCFALTLADIEAALKSGKR